MGCDLGFSDMGSYVYGCMGIEGEMEGKWICTLVSRCPYGGESMRMNQMIYLRAAFVHVNSGTVGKVAASEIYFPKVFGSPQ